MMSYFNVRAYGILINDRREVLLSDEYEYGIRFTKFPGGGVKLGEGIREALIREYQEECGIGIRVLGHIHTTDVLIRSAFNNSQVIAVYYLVTADPPVVAGIPASEKAFDFDIPTTEQQAAMQASGKKIALQSFRWVPVIQLDSGQLSFEMDRYAWQAYLSFYNETI